ncbi:DUF4097 family beta strand repeat-containing protein [Klugiella xanthotipulae]|uniref:Putative adhesin n=1 Tax=Klugiella xanthotipulae TaxID=244735 RepID=A0A543I4P1_9MICO|nr:DUF4097 family beta strand repeat-containing protein [Klugiella xanthotipulae]TQM65450.1 putative adhesin [Klugiella xanthotipulae]
MASEKWLIQPGESKIIDLELIRSLKLGMIAGQVDVIAHDEPGARVEVHTVSGKDLRIEISGDRLDIDHPQLRWDNFIEAFRAWRGFAKADISVLVPRDVAITFGVVSASGLVSGFTSDAKLNTVSGELVIDGLTGKIDVNSVSGDVSIRDHRGNVRVHTVSGDILANGELNVFTSDTVSGNVMLDAYGVPDRIGTNTVSGTTTVRLDAGVGARYRVNSVGGKLRLDGDVITGVRGGGYTTTTGNLDGAWVELSANSVSGNISVIHRAATPSTDTSADAGASDEEATA